MKTFNGYGSGVRTLSRDSNGFDNQTPLEKLGYTGMVSGSKPFTVPNFSNYSLGFERAPITWANIEECRERLKTWTPKMLEGLKDLLMAELVCRDKANQEATQKELLKQRLCDPAVLDQISNFFMGVAHAMACRAVLRWSKGHAPFGRKAVGGSDWNAHEGARVQYMFQNDLCPKAAGSRGNDPNHRFSQLAVNPLVFTTHAERMHLLKPLFRSENKYGTLYSAPINW